MIKKLTVLVLMSLCFMAVYNPPQTDAQGTNVHVVKTGESMWKISVKYQIGLSEIIQANPSVKSAMIYPNQKLNIPNIDNVKNVEEEVLSLVNQERSKIGLKPFQMDWELSRVARMKSKIWPKRITFSHTSPTYGSPFDMMKQFGISSVTAGENIASGQTTPKEVMESWMNSQGHGPIF